MHSHRRLFIEQGALAGLFLTGALLERARGGFELLYAAFALLLIPGALRRFLAWRGRLGPASPAVTLLELISFSGLVTYPIACWTHALMGLALVLLSVSGAHTEERAHRLEEGVVLALGLLALSLAWIRSSAHAGGIVLVFALEAWAPGAARTTAAAARRTASFALASAAALLRGYYNLGAEDFLLVLAGTFLLVVVPVTAVALHRRYRARYGDILTLAVTTGVMFLWLNLFAALGLDAAWRFWDRFLKKDGSPVSEKHWSSVSEAITA